MSAHMNRRRLIELVVAAFVSIAAAFGTVIEQSSHTIECPPANTEPVSASQSVEP